MIADLRAKFNAVLPDIEWEFPGILGDLIGDLTSEPEPIEVKLFSTDIEFLKKKAPEVEEQIGKVKGRRGHQGRAGLCRSQLES